MRMLRRLAVAVAMGGLAAVAPAVAAPSGTIAGRISDARIPSPEQGVAVARAVDAQTGRIVQAVQVNRSGAYALRVPAGVYLVAASVDARGVRPRASFTAPLRARRGRRTIQRVSLRGPRTSHAIPTGPPPIAIKAFAGSGPNAYLGKGLADMLITDIVPGDGSGCTPTVLEWEKRGEILKEIALQQRNPQLFDPSTIVHPHWTEPGIFVEGSVTTTDDTVSWNVRLRDAKTGKVVGGDEGSTPNGTLLEAETALAKHLLEQLCARSYTVAINVHTDALLATYTAVGDLVATVTATSPAGSGRLPVRWTGSGPLAYANVSFASHTECTYGSPVGGGAWTVTLAVTPAGLLHVTWTPSRDVMVTATMSCAWQPPASVPGQPGPDLVGVTPVEFDLAPTGGTQTIAGGVSTGGDGFSHSGTITVTRRK